MEGEETGTPGALEKKTKGGNKKKFAFMGTFRMVLFFFVGKAFCIEIRLSPGGHG